MFLTGGILLRFTLICVAVRLSFPAFLLIRDFDILLFRRMLNYSKHRSSAYKDHLPTLHEFQKQHRVGQYAMKGHDIAD